MLFFEFCNALDACEGGYDCYIDFSGTTDTQLPSAFKQKITARYVTAGTPQPYRATKTK